MGSPDLDIAECIRHAREAAQDADKKLAGILNMMADALEQTDNRRRDLALRVAFLSDRVEGLTKFADRLRDEAAAISSGYQATIDNIKRSWTSYVDASDACDEDEIQKHYDILNRFLYCRDMSLYVEDDEDA